MRKLTHLSLFSGIGGLDLAAEWAGIQTVGQCEWAEYPTKVLERHWPDVPRWKDIRTLTKESFYERTDRRTVDIISGGFPCQPFSVAGKQRGKEDDRYLWPEMVRVIKELRPTWVIGENVAGIVRMALPDILSELEACGYRTRVFLIPACAVGARHRRYRVAIVAHAGHDVLQGWECKAERSKRTPCHEPESCSCGRTDDMENSSGIGRSKPENVREQQGGTESKRSSKNLADTEGQTEGRLSSGKKTEKPGFGSSGQDVQYPNSAGCKEQHTSKESDKQGFPGGRRDEGDVCDTASQGLPDWTNKSMEGQGTSEQKPERPVRWPAESVLGRVVNGIPAGMDRDFLINHYWDVEPDIPRIASGIEHRVERLKCLGNAVVPQQFYPVFMAIAELNAQTAEQNLTRNKDQKT